MLSSNAFARRYARALALVTLALASPATALAQTVPPTSCGEGNNNGFDMGKGLSTLQYIANMLSGPYMKAIIIIGVVVTVAFLLFSGDNVSGTVKAVVGIVVGVIFILALIAWLNQSVPCTTLQ